MSLRRDVIESVHLFNADLAYMTTFGALHSHQGADVEKGSLQANMLYYDAMAHLPYLTQGKGGEDMMNEERMGAIDEFRKMRDRTLKIPRKK